MLRFTSIAELPKGKKWFFYWNTARCDIHRIPDSFSQYAVEDSGKPKRKEEMMHIHNREAVSRDIHFIQHVDLHSDVQASEECCWNCLWSVMTYDSLWCDREMEDVHFRDLCKSWEGELPESA